MGEEIATHAFSQEDFKRFEHRLRDETDLLEVWFRNNRFSETAAMGGSELEAWLVDKEGRPAPRNLEFLEYLNSPLVVQELSKFNIEFNSEPQFLSGRALGRMEEGLQETWAKALQAAEDLGLYILQIGILPTVTQDQLVMANMSSTQRFKAINEQVFRMRKGKPIHLKFDLNDTLDIQHTDVMLEAGATSFQIHLKVNQGESAAAYNVSKMVSGPLVAVSANSPYLFGRNLWAETRIKIFEKAVSVGDWDYAERVTFGIRYIDESLCEVFVANRQRYPAVLPQVFDGEPQQSMRHVRLHNGTIWRWNRPILGFDYDGTPHLRMEQRVVPAGPTITDNVANAAFYFGMMRALMPEGKQLVWDMPFADARDNFYAGARHGLDATMVWCGEEMPVRDLILKKLLPTAAEGLRKFDMDQKDIDRYLGIIEARAASGQNGATWQRKYVSTHGASMLEMTSAYKDRQVEGAPVHEWSV